MEQLHLPAVSRAQGSITLPGSKSISNRTLLLASMASGYTEIRGLLLSDDTERMIEGLQKLGVKLVRVNTGNWIVQGAGGTFPVREAEIFLGNAGTALRPLTAVLSVYGGDYILSGVPRMHERPIKDLVDALRLTGSNIEYLGNEGFPPLKINNSALPSPLHKSIKIRGDVSSQFLTAILIALPLRGEEFAIEVLGELISKPYIQITINLMAKFGVTVINDNWKKFTIKTNCHYQSPAFINVEGDASSASYFLAAGAIGGDIQVDGLGKNSIQGDVRFADAIELMGGKISYGENHIQSQKAHQIKAIDLDCNHIPDAAMTLAIMALFAQGNSDQERTTTLRNIASWRVKETDRLTAMATELRKVGAIVIEGEDYLTITPPAQLTPNAVIDTYDDHRMAMCFSLVSLGGVPITINDPKCVNKTFPNYFDEFKKLVS